MYAVGHAVHDPKNVKTSEQTFDEMDSQLYPVYSFCEARDATTVASLESAPDQTQLLLKNHQLLPEIMKYIHGRRLVQQLAGDKVANVWADEQERKDMDVCHEPSVAVLMKFLGSITHRSFFRALDVAGGDGMLSASFLLKYYGRVDLFDQCAEAIKRAKRAMQGHKALGYTT